MALVHAHVDPSRDASGCDRERELDLRRSKWEVRRTSLLGGRDLALLLNLTHRVVHGEVAEALARAVKVDELGAFARRAIDRRLERWGLDGNFGAIGEDLVRARTDELVPAIVQVPPEAVVGCGPVCRRVENLGNELPVSAVLLLEREHERVLLGRPVQRDGPHRGRRDRRWWLERLGLFDFLGALAWRVREEC